MEKAVLLRIRKDLDSRQQQNIIKLKGTLISKGYTEIIHIKDQDEDFHINSFEIPEAFSNEVHEYISDFIAGQNLGDTIVLC
ncbi:hypothetical protein [Flavobacterium sp.]|uniref:hypothetical protein n=1 Tax=Flavobacterium sp. TaxID=239 RepID=UPI002CAC0D9B|nr:hypothetical protein [Flavobacterium sp.]HSD06201.1 hypothetical protein [Flavobacterium sp.]